MNDVIEIKLPYPPSANKLWRIGRKINGRGRMIRTAEYELWLTNVERYYFSVNKRDQRVGASKCEVEIIFFPPKRGKIDVDNRCKAVLDSMTRLRVWDDDSQVERLTVTKGVPAYKPFAVIRIKPVQEFEYPSPKDFGEGERPYKTPQRKKQ